MGASKTLRTHVRNGQCGQKQNDQKRFRSGLRGQKTPSKAFSYWSVRVHKTFQNVFIVPIVHSRVHSFVRPCHQKLFRMTIGHLTDRFAALRFLSSVWLFLSLKLHNILTHPKIQVLRMWQRGICFFIWASSRLDDIKILGASSGVNLSGFATRE